MISREKDARRTGEHETRRPSYEEARRLENYEKMIFFWCSDKLLHYVLKKLSIVTDINNIISIFYECKFWISVEGMRQLKRILFYPK